MAECTQDNASVRTGTEKQASMFQHRRFPFAG